MADDNIFDKTKIIAALRAQGVSEKEIAKLYGPQPPKTNTQPNSKRIRDHQKKNAWKYDNKHIREVREEDLDPDYEPIEELRKKSKKTSKPRISRKKPKPKPKKMSWSASDEERLKALYEAGYSISEMAKEFGITADAITGKLTRMRQAGWKGQIGTTHQPLPKGKPSSKLSDASKRALANILETNFGVAGRYFAKKWGLYTGKDVKGGGGADVTAAVIKANEMVMSSLIRLDRTLRRGTSSLTKALSVSTAKMSDAINNVADLIRKHQTTEMLSGGKKDGDSGPVPTSGAGGGTAMGIIAAVLGGAALSALMTSRADASLNYNDRVEDIPPEPPIPEEPKPDPVIPEAEIKVKELTFEADDIIFEADQFKFTNKDGIGFDNPMGGPKAGAGATGGAAGSGSIGVGGDGAGLSDGMPTGPTPGSDAAAPGGAKLKDRAGRGKVNPKTGPASFSERFNGDGSNAVGGNEYLKKERAAAAEQIDKDPQLRKEIAAIAAMEGHDHPEAVIESLINRHIYTGKSLKSLIHGGFYGPVNKGRLPGQIEKMAGTKLEERMNKAIDNVVKGGSNIIEGATDQGMPTDPNGAHQGGRIQIGGNVFNDFGGGRGGHEGARQFREEQQRKVREADERAAAEAKQDKEAMAEALRKSAAGRAPTPEPKSAATDPFPQLDEQIGGSQPGVTAQKGNRLMPPDGGGAGKSLMDAAREGESGPDATGTGKPKRIPIEAPVEYGPDKRADAGGDSFDPSEILSTQGPRHVASIPGIEGGGDGVGA